MSAVVTITIREGNEFAKVAAADANPASHVSFVVVNRDHETHVVWVDPDEVLFQGKKANPFVHGNTKVTVAPGGVGVIHQHVKSTKELTAINGGKIDSMRFKYSVASLGKTETAVLDPDLDVTDPPGSF